MKKTAVATSRAVKDSKRMCRISTHPFRFGAYRNKQDIWAPKCHLLGKPKPLLPISKEVIL